MAFITTPAHQDIFDAIKAKDRNLVIEAVAGSGKCLGRGIPVLTFDGDIVPVEDVQVGDLLMGPDSKPREVLSVARGTAPMFEIQPTKGDPWTCNDVHMLTLVESGTGEVFDMPLNIFMQERGTRRCAHAKLFRVGVEFSEPSQCDLDPYLLGLWIGDGTTTAPVITNPDQEIVNECMRIAPKYGAQCVVKQHEARCQTIRFRMGKRGEAGRHTPHRIWRLLSEHVDGDGRKNILKSYLTASRHDRLELLAGIIDSDGHLGSGYYEVTAKHRHLADQYAFLARSLGFSAFIAPKTGTIRKIGLWKH